MRPYEYEVNRDAVPPGVEGIEPGSYNWEDLKTEKSWDADYEYETDYVEVGYLPDGKAYSLKGSGCSCYTTWYFSVGHTMADVITFGLTDEDRENLEIA